jgi:hypothetical protein
MRSRIDIERSAIATDPFQNNVFPPPLPPTYSNSNDASATIPQKESSHALSFHNYAENRNAIQHTGSFERAEAKALPQNRNYFPISASVGQQQHSSGFLPALVVPRRHNHNTATNQNNFPRQENAVALQNFVPNYTNTMYNNSQDERDAHNDDNRFNHGCDDDDLVPLPIDHPEQDDDIIEMSGL